MNTKESKKLKVNSIWRTVLAGLSAVAAIIALLKEWELFFTGFNMFIESINFLLPFFALINSILLLIIIFKIYKSNKHSAYDEKIMELNNLCKSLKENCDKCSNNIINFENIHDKMTEFGIYDIGLRENYNNDFYKKIYDDTSSNLIISGHSLNNNINKDRASDLRNALLEAIIRVLKNGGTVKILLQKPNTDDISANKKRELFNDFIEELITKIITQSKKEKWSNVHTIYKRFLIKQINNLRYLIVKNDNTTLISHYKMAQYNDNKNIYIFKVNPNEKFGECYLDDFNYVFDKCSDFVQESIDQLKRLPNIH